MSIGRVLCLAAGELKVERYKLSSRPESTVPNKTAHWVKGPQLLRFFGSFLDVKKELPVAT